MHYSFNPIKASFDYLVWLTSGIIILCTLVAYFINKNKSLDTTRKNIIYMICFFIGFISLISLGSRVITIFRLKPFEIDAMKITTPYGETKLKDIRDFYIQTDRQYKPNSPTVPVDSTRLLIIFDRKLKRQVYSEADYPIDSIFKVLDKLVD